MVIKLRITIIGILAVSMMSSCIYKLHAYKRFNVNAVTTKQNEPLILDRYIYCGFTKALNEPEIANPLYKDTIINMLFRSLREDSIVQFQQPIFELHSTCNPDIKLKDQFQYAIDSLVKKSSTLGVRLIPIVAFSNFDDVNTSNAMQGHITHLEVNILHILFCVIHDGKIEYIRGQRISWTKSEMKYRFLKQEKMDKLVSRSLRKYKKALVKPRYN